MQHLIVADSVRTAAGILGDAVLVDAGRVVAVGTAEALRSEGMRETLYSGVIVPGLRDAHLHPAVYAASLAEISLKTAKNFADIGDRVSTAGASKGPGVPVSALRLDDESLAEARLPTRHDLDAMVADRPVLLHRYCGHVAVANTAALDLAGVGPDTLDSSDGSFDREDGVPNGILRETAVAIVSAAVSRAAGPAVGPEQVASAMRGLAGLGITGIGAIVGMGDGNWADLGDETKLVAEAAADIPIKLNCFVIAETEPQLEEAAERLRDAGHRIRWVGLKAFSDGSLGGHTAAMHQPFTDRPDELGTVRLDPEWAFAMARHTRDMGGRVAIHAIGDRANAMVLDVMERLIADATDPAMLRIEHASVLGPDEIRRFADSGVTASVQPAFLASETGWLEKRVGDRIRTTYPFRTLLEAGVPLAGGSDCPVEPPHPLWGMATARDRSGIVPAEGLGAEDALALFTHWAAEAVGEPEPLAEGSPADLVVLDMDPVVASPDALRIGGVVATYVDGDVIDVPDNGLVWQG